MKSAIGFLILLALVVPTLPAQSATAELRGFVMDPSRSPIPGARVVMENIGTGIRREVSTGEAGGYLFNNLQPGQYRLEVSADGFQTATVDNIRLDVNRAAAIDVPMTLGSVSETVDVVAEGLSVETTTGQLGSVVTEEKITELPLNGRNFSQLLTLTPGAAPVSVAQNSGGAQVQRVGSFSFPAINGQTNRSNFFMLDGVYNNGHYAGTYAIAPNIDGLSQFKVQSHSDQAEFGGVSGGVVNILSKSGSNEFHGAAYWFLRNDALDARGFFTAQKPTLRQNQFGATLGGPIIKNKTFFFGSYEGYRFTTPSARLYIVPTPQELNGDFSASARNIFDPLTSRPDPNNPGRFLRDRFPNNQIPQARLNGAIGEYAREIIPAPIDTGTPGFNARNNTGQSSPLDQYSIRVDHTWSDRDSTWARYSWGEQEETVPQALENALNITRRPVKNLGVSHLHIFSSNTVLTGLVGYSSLVDDGRGLITERNIMSELFPNVPLDPAVNAPGFGLPSAFSVGGNVLDRTQEAWQFRGALSHVQGAHSFKLGGEVIRRGWDPLQSDFNLTFNALQTADLASPGTTGNDIASFVLGVHEAWQYVDRLVVHRTYMNHVFFQDSWRVNQRLTLNLGMRWDYFTPPDYSENFPSTWDFNTGKFLVGLAQPQACGSAPVIPCLPDPNDPYIAEHVIFTGRTKIRQNQFTLPGPRFGLAYRIAGGTVFRGAFAVFHDLEAGVSQQGQNVTGGWPGVGLQRGLNQNRVNVEFTADDPFRGRDPRTPTVNPSGAAAFMYDPQFRQPYSAQWNAEIQHELRRNNTLSVAYVGSNNTHLAIGGSYNTALTPGPGPIAPRALWPHAPATNYDRSIGQSSYHGLQVKAEQRFSEGLSYLTSYTWSKSIDVASSGQFGVESGSIQNAYDPNSSRSVSGFDIPHVFTTALLYDLPFGQGRRWGSGGALGRVIGNWRVNAIVSLRSGQPFTPQMNVDTANIGAVAANSRTRPDLVGEPKLSNPTPERWFDTAAYRAPAPFVFGTAGRNQVRSDAAQNVDLSFFREDRVNERLRSQLRVEMFNAFNHPTFGIPQTLFTNPQFGRVSSTISTARQIQLGLKLMF